MSKKRGQITLFIMLGVVLVILFSIFFYVINYSKESTIGLEVEETFGRDIKDINLFVETCFDSKVKSGLDLLGKQGGYIKSPNNVNFIRTSETELPLHYDEETISLPILGDMEIELSRYIEHDILLCINDFRFFEEIGFEISDAEIDTEVDISDNSVYIKLDYPVKIKDKANNIVTLTPFNKNIPIKLKKMHEFAQVVVSKALEYDQSHELLPDLNINSYIDDFELVLDYYPIGFQTILWQVEGRLGENPYYFLFSTRFKRELPNW